MLRIVNLSKSFGGQQIFEDVSFTIGKQERVGLVGRNGNGKTTLFRIIQGLEEPDSGEIIIPSGYRIGYLTQSLDFTGDTILTEGCRGLPKHHADDQWRVEKVLTGLGFSPADMQRHPAEFSGGFQVRLNLTKALVSDADLLLLDEPTNYLDVVSIRWLGSFLRQWRGEICLITHDRAFMDGVVTSVAAIHRRRVRKMSGTTEKLYDTIRMEEEIYEKTRLNDEKKRKQVELYISRFRSKARLATNVQSRIKALNRKEQKDKLEEIKELEFSFGYEPTPAKALMNAISLNFSYVPEVPLIRDFSLTLQRHDRICVIGHNGKGKTTLLRLLVEDLTPQEGEISLHNKTTVGYFAQTNIADLRPDSTIEEELMSAGCGRQRARNIAGAMMFEGDMAEKPTHVLSGGEKSRVLLGKVLAQKSNLLLLDEPTNHLDMQACDAFLGAIDSFEGAVVMVTHNEMFLHHLANRFVVFQEDKITLFEGSYLEFLEKVGWSAEAVMTRHEDPPVREQQKEESRELTKKELRRLRAEFVKRTSREVTPLRRRAEKLEKTIMEAEDELASYNQAIIDASPLKDGKKISQLLKKISRTQNKIEELFEELEKVTEKADQRSSAINAEMAALRESK